MEHRCNLDNLKFHYGDIEQDGNEVIGISVMECMECGQRWKVRELFVLSRIDYTPIEERKE